MKRILRGFAALIVVLVGWCGVLWWLIAPDFSQWRLPGLAAIHALPPLGIWSGVWFGLRLWRQRQSYAAEQNEAVAEADRQAKLEAARQQHVAERQRLHFSCDCRALALVQVSASVETSDNLIPENAIFYYSILDSAEVALEDDLLEHLRPVVAEALLAIYSQCAAAVAFPIYVSSPSDVVGDDVIALLQQTRAASVAQLQIPALSVRTEVLFLLARDRAADTVIGLFEANPDLAGAVIVAFDSPWWREQQRVATEGEGADDSGLTEQRKWIGHPGQGVFALALTHPGLPAMLKSLPQHRLSYDAMTPYWEKEVVAANTSASLATLQDVALEGLKGPALARIHRGASALLDAKPTRRIDFAQSVEALIERAQIHAALIDLAFESPCGSVEAKADATPSPFATFANNGNWLIHNAGGIDRAGNRLAALGVALLNRQLEIDPIDTATNLTVLSGDLGQARSIAMLALTVARAASSEGAALCAEFAGNDRLTLSFAVAPQGLA